MGEWTIKRGKGMNEENKLKKMNEGEKKVRIDEQKKSLINK